MYIAVEKKRFVYGDFMTAQQVRPRALSPIHAPYAIEILREFSASEFIGRVYERTPTQEWNLLRPSDANQAPWYKTALKQPQAVGFEMEGAGHWMVQNVRTESDDRGSYVAVALKSR